LRAMIARMVHEKKEMGRVRAVDMATTHSLHA